MTDEQQPTASLEQVQASIEAFDHDTFLKLGHVAMPLIRGTSYQTPEDLLQDALMAALELRRKWRPERTFVSFLYFAMKSIASNDRACLRARSEFLAAELVNEIDRDDDQALDGADCRSHVQNRLADEVEEEAQSSYRRRAQALFELFADDDQITLILRAMEEGYRGQEIAQQCSLTARQYVAARKRMNRRLDSVYPRRASS